MRPCSAIGVQDGVNVRGCRHARGHRPQAGSDGIAERPFD